MKKLLLILLVLPFTVFSQNIDTTHIGIARDLGYCFNKLKPKYQNPDSYYPLCYSDVRVFHIKPDYYCIYIDAAPFWCGSCGCHLEILRRRNDIYEEVGSISCVSIDKSQPVNDFIIIQDGFLATQCQVSYSGKYNINNATLKLLEVVSYEHKFHGLESYYDTHKSNCIYNDSSWLTDRAIE